MVSGRRERRLRRFATENRLQFSVEAANEKRAASVFRAYDERSPVGWFGVPGAAGFEVGQHRATVYVGGGDNSAMTTRWTWAVFTMRTTPTGTEALHRAISGFLPRGWRTEVSGRELFVYTSRRKSLTSRRLWRYLWKLQASLELVLARPERTAESADRRRRCIRIAITPVVGEAAQQ